MSNTSHRIFGPRARRHALLRGWSVAVLAAVLLLVSSRPCSSDWRSTASPTQGPAKGDVPLPDADPAGQAQAETDLTAFNLGVVLLALLMIPGAAILLAELFLKQGGDSSFSFLRRMCGLPRFRTRIAEALDRNAGLAPASWEGESASEAPAQNVSAPFCAGKTVLIVDDDFEITQMLMLRFERMGMIVWRTPDGIQALLGARAHQPDLIVLDVAMPSGSGLAVCEMMKSSEGFARVPMIVYTGASTDEIRQRCRELGVYHVLKGPNSWAAIEQIVGQLFCERDVRFPCDADRVESGLPDSDMAGADPDAAAQAIPDREAAAVAANDAVEAAIAMPPWNVAESAVGQDDDSSEDFVANPAAAAAGDASAMTVAVNADSAGVGDAESPGVGEESAAAGDGEPQPGRRPLVMVIDDNPDFSTMLATRLRAYDIDVVPAYTGMDGFWRAIAARPDVILCDMVMPDGNGNYVVGRLRSHPITESTPIIMISGMDGEWLRRMMMNIGVTACFPKPIVMNDLINELRRHIALPRDRGRRAAPQSVLMAP